jgi:hypothetical protein
MYVGSLNENLILQMVLTVTVLCGTNNILWNISHIQYECEEYYA